MGRSEAVSLVSTVLRGEGNTNTAVRESLPAGSDSYLGAKRAQKDGQQGVLMAERGRKAS